MSERREYIGGDIPDVASPEALFTPWLAAADAELGQDARAMTLATTSADGSPDARVVLLRHWQDGCLGFFGGGESAKGQAFRHRPQAALVFFWPGIDRQVRIQGTVEQLPMRVIEDYFSSRPAANRLAAAMATQSEELTDEDGWHGLHRRYQERLPEAESVIGRQIGSAGSCGRCVGSFGLDNHRA